MDMSSKIQQSLNEINKIHEVKGFDPNTFAVEYTDATTGEVRKRIPVVVLIAWFRMVYPEGKITLESREEANGGYVATARVYPKYTDTGDAYLAEASASRMPIPEKPFLPPRECAQTAAVGIALRNAGFGVQFNLVGDDLSQDNSVSEPIGAPASTIVSVTESSDMEETYERPVSVSAAAPSAEGIMDLKTAMQMPCPIRDYKGKTLGDVLRIDVGAIKWIAERYSKDPKVKEAAKFICEHAANNY